MNYYLILRAIPFLLAAQSSMFAINDWLSVMLGPDCWNFSPKELNIDHHQHLGGGNDDRYGTYASSGQRYGVNTELLTDPIAQSLRYAVSGVGVHLAFIACTMIYIGVHLHSRDNRAPLFMLILDGITFGNAMGLFHPNTAGHPRCLDEDIPMAECAKALMTFAPVVVMDAMWFLVVLLFPGGGGGGRTENHPTKRD